ncbi:unnamed protein product, partial [Rangifer tarandus platyrhynchus]
SRDCSPPGSMEFSQQDYWSGLPFSTSGDLPNSGVESVSPALTGRFFSTFFEQLPNCLPQCLPHFTFPSPGPVLQPLVGPVLQPSVGP